MKRETIMARLSKGGMLKKNGEIKCNFPMWQLKKLAEGKRLYPLSWGSGWHSLEGVAKKEKTLNALNALKIKFIEDNDAPKCGVVGYYIEVKDRANLKKLNDILAMIS